jgi:hypothetical protein
VTTIRPNPPPIAPAKPADTARLAAKAFFEIAAGKAPAPLAAAPQATPTVAAAPVTRTPQPPAEPPAQPLRPGSFLDIRV